MESEEDIFADLLSTLEPSTVKHEPTREEQVSMEQTRQQVVKETEVESTPVRLSNSPIGEPTPAPASLTKEEIQSLVKQTVRETLHPSLSSLACIMKTVLNNVDQKLGRLEGLFGVMEVEWKALKKENDEKKTDGDWNRMEESIKGLSKGIERVLEKQDVMNAQILINKYTKQEAEEQKQPSENKEEVKEESKVVKRSSSKKKKVPVVESEEEEERSPSPVPASKKHVHHKPTQERHYSQDLESLQPQRSYHLQNGENGRPVEQTVSKPVENYGHQSGSYAPQQPAVVVSSYKPPVQYANQPSPVPPPQQPPVDNSYQNLNPTPQKLPTPPPPVAQNFSTPAVQNFTPSGPPPPIPPPALPPHYQPRPPPPSQPTMPYTGYPSLSNTPVPVRSQPVAPPPGAHPYNAPSYTNPVSARQSTTNPASGGDGGPQTMSLDTVIDDVAAMGFDRTLVRSVVTDLLNQGNAPLDMNLIIDRLTNLKYAS